MTMVSLAEIAVITAGQSPPGDTYNEHGIGVPFFQGKADFGETHPTARKWCTAPKKIAEAGDILISVRAPVGPTNIAAARCCIGRGLAAIRPNTKVAVPDFIHWVLRHREPHLAARASGTTFAAVGQKDLKSLLVPLPPLDEQRRIASILNRAAKIERLRAQAQKCLREFIPALFVEMFGDPATNPKDWPMSRLGDVCSMDRRGLHPDDPVAPDLPFVGLEHIESASGKFEFDRYSRAGTQRSTTFLFDERHILYAKLRPYLNKVAIPTFEGRCSTELIPLLPRKGVDREFIALLLRNQNTVNYLMASVTGARMPRTDMTMLMSLPVPVPPLDKRRRFTEIVRRADALESRTSETASRVTTLTASLMSQLLAQRA